MSQTTDTAMYSLDELQDLSTLVPCRLCDAEPGERCRWLQILVVHTVRFWDFEHFLLELRQALDLEPRWRT